MEQIIYLKIVSSVLIHLSYQQDGKFCPAKLFDVHEDHCLLFHVAVDKTSEEAKTYCENPTILGHGHAHAMLPEPKTKKLDSLLQSYIQTKSIDLYLSN